MDTIEYVKERLKIAFYDMDYTVRKTVSNVMSMIVVRGGFNVWPDLLPFLTENINQPQADQSILENAIHAISIIVEDC
jgi:hypothetical protein